MSVRSNAWHDTAGVAWRGENGVGLGWSRRRTARQEWSGEARASPAQQCGISATHGIALLGEAGTDMHVGARRFVAQRGMAGSARQRNTFPGETRSGAAGLCSARRGMAGKALGLPETTEVDYTSKWYSSKRYGNVNETEVTGMPETERRAAEGMRVETRDHALARLDEKEIRERMDRAFDAFVQQGFEVHLVGVASRGAIEYSLLLAEDGADDVPVRDIQQIADDHRLDVFVQRGIGLRLYPRW